MGNATPIAPDTITIEEFQHALSRYDQVIEAISTSKGSKSQT